MPEALLGGGVNAKRRRLMKVFRVGNDGGLRSLCGHFRFRV